MTLPLHTHGEPGLLVAVCGMDGAGKTTLIDALSAGLAARGKQVLNTMQPSRYARESPLFERYIYHPDERHLVDYRALICLLTSDRLQHIHETVLPALRAGTAVISDRYIFTAVAQMRARGYRDEAWFLDIVRHIPRPDLTVLCDPGFEVSQARVGRRTEWREAYIERSHDQLLHEEFQLLADEEDMARVDTTGPTDSSVAALLARLCPTPESRHGSV